MPPGYATAYRYYLYTVVRYPERIYALEKNCQYYNEFTPHFIPQKVTTYVDQILLSFIVRPYINISIPDSPVPVEYQ